MNVSHMAIRRNIQMLEKDGKATIISSGAKLNEVLKQELPWQEKAQLHHQNKRNIARVAEKLVESGHVIYLDAGTITYEITRSIADQLKKVTTVTNDFTIGDYLMERQHITFFHTGGQVDRRNQSCIGNSAADFIRGLNLDIAFISSSSWDIEHSLSTPDEGKSLVKQAALANSCRSVLVSDSSKYGMFHTLSDAGV
ncbi:DeoR/GlpR family DNA-binding transcription regulator [Sodalis sp. (in: enterobacteria)]|uniref:DeoR/GlpR family DNA-binding transcription regulator n=1 Tax=Sodalis sp. (in: enterobacteria) TaxID=1898979 RepID=UPI003F6833FC